MIHFFAPLTTAFHADVQFGSCGRRETSSGGKSSSLLL